MKVLILEDERLAAEGLISMLMELRVDVIGVLPSVQEGKAWFETNKAPDLVLSDIQLQDGLSFQLFQELDVKVPIVFITAYDHYAIKAFEVNSIDYLLKPIDRDSLEKALNKFTSLDQAAKEAPPYDDLLRLISEKRKNFKSRFLIKVGQKIKAVAIEKVAYFYSQNKLTYLVTHDKQRLPLDLTLENLETQLDPERFYRANRQFIVGFDAISELHPYFKGRLKVELDPSCELELVVSSDKTREFKSWLDK